VAQTRDVEIVTRIQTRRRSATAAPFLFSSNRAPATARAPWSISTTITVPGGFFCATNVGYGYGYNDGGYYDGGYPGGGASFGFSYSDRGDRYYNNRGGYRGGYRGPYRYGYGRGFRR